MRTPIKMITDIPVFTIAHCGSYFHKCDQQLLSLRPLVKYFSYFLLLFLCFSLSIHTNKKKNIIIDYNFSFGFVESDLVLFRDVLGRVEITGGIDGDITESFTVVLIDSFTDDFTVVLDVITFVFFVVGIVVATVVGGRTRGLA